MSFRHSFILSTKCFFRITLGIFFVFRNNHFRITELDIKAINESDIIMSFANRGRQEDLQWTKLFWLDYKEDN